MWSIGKWWDNRRLECLQESLDAAKQRYSKLRFAYHSNHDLKGCSHACRTRKIAMIEAYLSVLRLKTEIAEIEGEKALHTTKGGRGCLTKETG